MEPRIIDLDEARVLDENDIDRLKQQDDTTSHEAAEKRRKEVEMADAIFKEAEKTHGGGDAISGGEEDEEDGEGEEMTQEVREEKSASEKEKGNSAFKEGKYDDAVTHWSRSLRTCRYILEKNVYPDDTTQQKIDILELQKNLQLNLAIGEIKRRNFPEAIDYCDRVLDKDPHNTKAQFRKADALYQVGEYSYSIETVEEMLSHDATNAAAIQLKAKAMAEQQRYKSREKKMMRQVMHNLENDPRSISKPGMTASIWSRVCGYLSSQLWSLFSATRWISSCCRRRPKVV